MGDTKLQTVLVTEPQERNTSNRVFGGFLMKSAYKLAWANAHKYTGHRPFFLALDKVNFIKPVEIGSILTFDSRIIYQEGKSFCVEVVSKTLNSKEGTEQTTNTYYFTLTCPEVTLKQIIPNTYEEAITYLEGRRRYSEGKDISKECESQLIRFY